MATVSVSFRRLQNETVSIVVAFVLLLIACLGRAHGTDWANETGDLCAVWGSFADDIFAVGKRGIIRHYDGNVWSVLSSGTSGSFTDAWGTSGTNVYAVGGDVFRYDENGWQPVPEPNEAEPVNIFGAAL